MSRRRSLKDVSDSVREETTNYYKRRAVARVETKEEVNG